MVLHRFLVLIAVLFAASVLLFAVISSDCVIANVQSFSDKESLYDEINQVRAALDSIQAAWVSEVYTRQASDRIQSLKGIDTDTSYGVLYSVIVPEVLCPYLVRMGKVGDGGKYVCNPKAFPTKNCSIYSFGLSDEVMFDVEIQQATGCNIYGYDLAEQSAETKTKYANINGKLGVAIISSVSSDGVSATIEDLLRRNGDDSAAVMKMDIEGAEHSALVPFLSKYKVCQILLEIHGQPREHLELLVSIAKLCFILDYALFSYEVNGYFPAACEYSFIHVDCMKRHGVVELKRYLHEIEL